MKKLFFLLSVLFFLQHSQAQTTGSTLTSAFVVDSIHTWAYDSMQQQWNNLKLQNSFSYDAKQNELGHLLLYWDGTQFSNSGLFTYQYDTDGNRIDVVEDGWYNQQWQKGYHTYYYFVPGTANSTGFVKFAGNGAQWENYDSLEVTYDANYNVLSRTSVTWATPGNVWSNNQRNSFTYNAQQQLNTDLLQYWDDQISQLDTIAIDHDNYDVNGDISYVHREGSYNSGHFLDSLNTLYMFNGSHQVLQTTAQFCFGGNCSNLSQVNYTYAGPYCTSILNKSWNGTAWYNSYEERFQYNSGRLTSDSVMNWQGLNPLMQSVVHYYYDNLGLMTDSTYKNWDNLGTVVLTNDSTHFYRSLTTGIEDPQTQAKSFVVAPNPCHDEFQISTSKEILEYRIFDLHGRELILQHTSGVNTLSVPVTDLAPGCYLVKVATKEGTYSRKVLKR